MIKRLNEPTKQFLFHPRPIPKQANKRPTKQPTPSQSFATYLQQAIQKDVN